MKDGFKEVKVEEGYIDYESMPIKCICGYGDPDDWEFVINYDEGECPKCGRKYYFTHKTTVYMKEAE